jgi:hypothetical protein
MSTRSGKRAAENLTEDSDNKSGSKDGETPSTSRAGEGSMEPPPTKKPKAPLGRPRKSDFTESPVNTFSAATGLLDTLSASLSTPYRIHPTDEVIVPLSGFEDYFGSAHDTYSYEMWPASRDVPPTTINRANFIKVCQYLLRARLDAVYSTCSGKRVARRIPIPTNYPVPKAISDVINGIGHIIMNGGGSVMIPKPEAIPQDVNETIDAQVIFNMLQSFGSFVNLLFSRGFIRLGSISNVAAGTAWWILSARRSDELATLATEYDTVVSIAAWPEWTPSDAVLSALVQRQLTDSLELHLQIDSNPT